MYILAILSTLIFTSPESPADSAKYVHYKDKITVYTLTGFNATNVIIKPKYLDFGRERYFLNPPLLLGFGVSYKGIDLGFTRRLGTHLVSENKFGKSDYFDFKLKFPIKRIFFAFRAQYYRSFALLNHDYPSNEVPTKHLVIPDFSTLSINLDARYFLKKDFSYRAALGFSGHYNEDFFTPYVFSYFGASAVGRDSATLLPSYAVNEIADVSKSKLVGCFEFGAIPGIAYVKRYDKWQGTLLMGWGPLFQTKWYETAEQNRAFFGLNTRTDLQLSFGYHQERWFLQFISEFQFRRINFRQMSVQQYYYDIRLFFGYLIKVKKHPKFILKLEEKGIL